MWGRKEEGLKRMRIGVARSAGHRSAAAAAAASAASAATATAITTTTTTITTSGGQVLTVSEFISQFDEAARRRLNGMNDKLRALETEMEALEAEMSRADTSSMWP